MAKIFSSTNRMQEVEIIEDANQIILDMLGFSIEEMVGKRLWEIRPFRDIEASQY
jgi:hypothetical protein